ncbi:MAG: putative rane spanning protein [Gammaproteobacteria bacterium]|jgi:uncharacterized membrane protein YfcA|nr:putative rane spanning protein [Gammaproteobacteria bacterium]
MALQLILDCILVAVGAGLVYGIFGGGSGLIMMPGFYYVLSHFSLTETYQMQTAVGTTALASGFLGIAAVRVQWKLDNIDFQVVKSIAPGIAIGTVTAVLLLNIIPSYLLKPLFGGVVIIVGIWLFFYKKEKDTRHWKMQGSRHRIMCFLIGLLWFLLGIGIFTVPYLHKCGLEMRRAVGCATFTTTVFSLTTGMLLMATGAFHTGASVTHLGFVNFLLVLIVVFPSALAAGYGSILSHKIPQQHLRIIYSILIGLVGALMLL